MGCFLGCFGAAEDGKRRKRKAKERGSSVQRLAAPRVSSAPEVSGKPDTTLPKTSSVPELPEKLDTEEARVSLVSESSEKPESPTDNIQNSDKPQERSNVSPRKRVTFDTNVKTYEHVSLYESNDFSRHNLEKSDEESMVKLSQSPSSSDHSSVTSNSASFPPNYRYQNCRESDDEEEDDEFDYVDSDLDDEDDEVLDEYSSDDGCYEYINDKICQVKHVYVEEVGDSSELSDCLDKKDTERHNDLSARVRSDYATLVLNPVENLTQWKALKSKGRTPQVKLQKENLEKSQEHSFSVELKSVQQAKNEEIAVDASLSTWLSSSETTRVSTSSSVGLEASPPERSGSCGSSSHRNLDDRPILGALTAEEIKQFSASSNSPRKSPTRRSPDDTPIIGMVGSYWSVASKDSSSVSSFKGIPNTTNKYREDKMVNWHSTPFETRLERALSELANDREAQNVR